MGTGSPASWGNLTYTVAICLAAAISTLGISGFLSPAFVEQPSAEGQVDHLEADQRGA